MIARHVFLVMLDHAGGTIAGKTLAQKRAYFVSRLLHIELGFSPHYYGPFSAELDSAIGACKALGFAREDVSSFGMLDPHGFEVKRYTYTLTEDGRQVVVHLGEKEAAEVTRVRGALDSIRQAGDDDYSSLSIAAKTFSILSGHEGTARPQDIIEAARQLGWELSSEQVADACAFLDKLGLISTM